MQTTNTVIMVRPTAFKANEETRESNAFQKDGAELGDVSSQALQAFDAYVAALRAADINVQVVADLPQQQTPDAVFPNNWLALLADGTLITFPMEALNRRRERRQDIIAQIKRDFVVHRCLDLSAHERAGQYLEGTGSLILDHQHKLAYACLSSRSSPEVGQVFTRLTGYRIIWFAARDRHQRAIYHTNVMLSIGQRFAIVCLQAVASPQDRQRLIAALIDSGKTIIDVTYRQMESFACNVLELCDTQGRPVYAMSTRAWQAFGGEQQKLIADYARLALGPVDIIEDLGGGGARCMLCEVFLQKRYAYC